MVNLSEVNLHDIVSLNGFYRDKKTMRLKNVVPFGRTWTEYCALFDLHSQDLDKKIVSVADGPASFNAEMSLKGRPVISVDPIYLYKGSEIHQQFYCVVDDIIRQVKNSPDNWVWNYHASPDELRMTRVKALEAFLADYAVGQKTGRYIPARLPVLPFKDGTFELALCSHFLFLYTDHLSLEFHVRSIREMLRIATEVRIFPLLTLALKASPYVETVLDTFRKEGYQVAIKEVDYELQRGANQMMVVRHP